VNSKSDGGGCILREWGQQAAAPGTSGVATNVNTEIACHPQGFRVARLYHDCVYTATARACSRVAPGQAGAVTAVNLCIAKAWTPLAARHGISYVGGIGRESKRFEIQARSADPVRLIPSSNSL